MRGNLVSRIRSLAHGLLAGAVLVSVAGLAVAAWDGTQGINLGDKISAEFAVADPNHHEFSFYAPKDTVLTVKAKAAAGLTLGFELTSDLGVEQDLGTTVSALGIKAYRITGDAFYTLHVRPASGSGVYSLTTKGKFPKKLKATLTDADFTCGAMKGALASATVKPTAGSTAAATITAVEYPGATVAGITAGATSFKAIPLPRDAKYTVDLAYSSPGSVDLTVSLKTKLPKRTWSFGVVDVAPGTATGIRADWMGSGHSDAASEAFRHWDEDGSVSTSCAKCHSSGGYQDWLGADGSAFEVVDAAAPLGTTVDCEACHNAEASTLSTVLFPSGARVDDLGPEARCLQCHQGRESGVSMNTMITMSGLADDAVATGSVPSGQAGAADKLSFKNVHYLAAGATLFGNVAKGGYQYAGKVYPDRFTHVESYDSCVECHNQHTLEVRTSACTSCHTGTDPSAYRMVRSTFDYDADGSVAEGMKGELDTLVDLLYGAIQDYAPAVTTNAIVYDSHSHPYWFKDTNANGVRDTGEGGFTTWTPRLVRAAYNYQFYLKDPGAFAHNSRYVLALVYDSLADLDSHADVTVPGMANLVRNDQNHFDYTAQAWNYSYFYPTVRAGCGRCHSPDGFRFYSEFVSKTTQIDYPNVITKTYGGMDCESCHVTGANFGADPALRTVKAVWFPGGKVIENTASDPSFTCITCHQGREGKNTVDAMIALSLLTDDAVATGTVGSGKTGEPNKLSFKNLHYLPAGATLFAADAEVGYQYPAKVYQAKWSHFDAAKTQCSFCHINGDHSFKPRLTDGADGTQNCRLCHATGTLEEQRVNRAADYDSDPATTTLPEEMEAFEEHLEEAIVTYAAAHGGGIVYDALSHPYFFLDANQDGIPDVDGALKKIGYAAFTPRLVRATFNFQFAHKEPGAWAHNTKYMLQLLYDSAQDLGADMTGFTRP